MICEHCGQATGQPAKFCPNCGEPFTDATAVPETLNATAAPETITTAAPETITTAAPETLKTIPAHETMRATAYVRTDYNPAKHGRAVTPAAAPAATLATGAQPGATARVSNAGMIVFSIVNIIFCGFGISLVLGVIALIMAIMAGDATGEDSFKKFRTARILNWIGLGFILLQLFATILFIVSALLFAG